MSRPSFAERTARRDFPGGARLLALENHFNPTIALSGSLRAGSAHSPAANPVLAALAAQMLEKGTRRRTKMELATELESRAITISFSAAGGDPDLLDIGMACLARDRSVALAALAEMLAEPAFPEEELAREKERLVGSVRQLDDQTGWRASTAASRLIFPPGHPYFQESAAEIIAAIQATTAADLRRLHEELYRSGSLVLAIVGDFDRTAALDELSGLLGRLPEGSVADPPFEPPGAPKERGQTVRMKDKPNADVVLAHDSRLRRADPDYIAVALGIAALGQSTLSSRLGLRVRDTEGLTYGINARASSGRWAGPFTIGLTVAPQNLERAVASALAVTRQFVAEGITEKEIADEKRSRVGKFKVDLASNAGIAGAIDMAESYGFGVSYLDEFPARVERVTREEIVESVRRHVRPDDLVRVAAGELP